MYDFPESFTIHCIEDICQIHEGRVEVGPHRLTLLLQSTGDEDHVGGCTMMAEVALAFRQETLFQMVVQAIEEKASEDFLGDVHQKDASMVVAGLAIIFPLVEMDDCGVLEILRDLPLTPHRQE
ncbi:hypothetical protein SprV_0200828000 [Sparganum proliferum]